MLQRGAARVAAVDVAYGQIDARLRKDPRVTVIERLNARALGPADLPFLASLATVDVSFISLTKVLPAVATCLAPGGEVLAMVKPQFELGRERVGRGVVRDPADRQEAVLKVALAAARAGLPVRGIASSGLPGPKGNRETFVWCGGDGPELEDLEAAIAAPTPTGVEGDGTMKTAGLITHSHPPAATEAVVGRRRRGARRRLAPGRRPGRVRQARGGGGGAGAGARRGDARSLSGPRR